MPVRIDLGREPVINEWGKLRKETVDEALEHATGKPRNWKERVYAELNDDGVPSYRQLLPRPNGFVHTIIEAFNFQHHLEFRPEDVLFAVLALFSNESSYCNQTASGKSFSGGLRASKDPSGKWVIDTESLEQVSQDVSLDDFTSPSFSTSTKDDQFVALMLLMAPHQKYGLREYTDFQPYLLWNRGFSSVTLLGDQGDWERLEYLVTDLAGWLLEKLEARNPDKTRPGRVEEARAFMAGLKPVLSSFVESFKEPTSKGTMDFWNTSCIQLKDARRHATGETTFSGWVMAFCNWTWEGPIRMGLETPPDEYILGAKYPAVRSMYIPNGYILAPVTFVEDNGEEVEVESGVGSVGAIYTRSDPDEPALDTVKPWTGHWAYSVQPCKPDYTLQLPH